MPHPPRRLDVVAGGLFVGCLLTVTALLSHDPADLPGTVYPTNPTPHNLLGPLGAEVSAGLLRVDIRWYRNRDRIASM